jgi:hypothetical protein
MPEGTGIDVAKTALVVCGPAEDDSLGRRTGNPPSARHVSMPEYSRDGDVPLNGEGRLRNDLTKLNPRRSGRERNSEPSRRETYHAGTSLQPAIWL